MLWRAFKGVKAGFYIDVGGFDPVVDSVTHAFYERGWSGLNIEPVPALAKKFGESRPRDINLILAVSDRNGMTKMFEIAETGLSTLDADAARLHSNAGRSVIEHDMETTTLAEICSKHVTGDIHFLKVDVEGAEAEVLRGMDFQRWRPRIVMVEATKPGTSEPSHESWEPQLLAQRYEFLWFDGLNRFYASQEKAGELRQHFKCPPNPFDEFQMHRELALLQKNKQARMDTQAANDAKEASASELKRIKEANHKARCGDREKVAAMQHLLRYHRSNPLRALALWWDHKFKSEKDPKF